MEILKTAQKLAQRHGIEVRVLFIDLVDGFGNQSRLCVSVDCSGFFRYSLGHESLSNLRNHRKLPVSISSVKSWAAIERVVAEDRDVVGLFPAEF